MASYRLGVSAPIIRERQFSKPLMCGPGPNDLYPAVAAAFAAPVLSPACEEYYKVIEDIRAGIQYAFQTRSKLVLAVSGSGHAGMETVICNLIEPGELLLVPSHGFWAERAQDTARRHGIRVEAIKTSEPFTTFSLEELESALKRHRPAGLFITHGDSSTGTLQTLEGLGDLCHKYDTLLLVDIVASLGAEPFLMDEWGVDGAYASCQKALSGPAGVAPVAFSARAEAKIFSRSHSLPFYFDVKFLARQWKCYDDTSFYHHTLSSPLLWALRACLSQLAHESLPCAWARHADVAARFHARLRAHGFRFLVRRPEDRMTAVTTVELPGMDCNTFVAQMRSKYDTLLLVDIVASLGAEPFLMDEWGVDGAYASCQKALSGPAGVAPVAFSARAEAKIFSRSHSLPFYFDIKFLARQWKCYDDTSFYHHTLSSPLLWALRACLSQLAHESLPCAWARHADVAARFHARLRAHGFRFLVRRPEDRMTAVTTVDLPGMDCNTFVAQMRSKHNIMITPGLGPTAGAAVRVGLMGVNASAAVADQVADAMADVAGTHTTSTTRRST